ncbi:hypothetical protein M9H77_18286 [Catharanthus roseus]|uniref:Uncharacterized protein n=1 Tax=Catharanthus roseus TaxID=4058 RepID=A0ACC0B713_CATRO|nr:hypothetical protein M9H77_18286 [Catharanthus roseus]
MSYGYGYTQNLEGHGSRSGSMFHDKGLDVSLRVLRGSGPAYTLHSDFHGEINIDKLLHRGKSRPEVEKKLDIKIGLDNVMSVTPPRRLHSLGDVLASWREVEAIFKA